MHLGDKITTKPTVKPARFANRHGIITVLNTIDNEIGTQLTGKHVTVWFRPDELEEGHSVRVYALSPANQENVSG